MITGTIGKALDDLFHFVMIAGIIAFAFCAIGFAFFGELYQEFRSIGKTSSTMGCVKRSPSWLCQLVRLWVVQKCLRGGKSYQESIKPKERGRPTFLPTRFCAPEPSTS